MSASACDVASKGDACICDWGKDCANWSKFLKEKKHPWGGLTQLEYTNSCGFQNLWRSCVGFLHPTAEQQRKIIERYESLRRHPESTDGGRPRRSTFKIAKHHFPLCIVEDGGKWGKWTSPMTMEEVEKLGCYPNMNPQDSLLRYDTGAGEGCSGEWKKKHPGALFIKAPRASHREVKAVVEQWKPNHNSNCNSNRITARSCYPTRENQQAHTP